MLAVRRCFPLTCLLGLSASGLTANAAPPTDEAWAKPLELKACEPAPLTLPKQTEDALHATLLVRVAEGVGSAVLISPDGFALTAAHVVGDAKTVSVVGDKGGQLAADVLRVDERHDVALLKVQLMGYTPCLSPVESRTPIGSDIFVLGSPAGEELAFSVAKGIVSGYRDFEGHKFVQLDASVNPGNSGGPVVNETGAIVGLASWKVSHVSMEGLAFAVPVESALSALDIEFTEKTDPTWASLGGRRSLPVAETGETPPAQATSADPAEPVPDAGGPGDSPVLTPYDPALDRRMRVRTGLIVGGAVVTGAGAVTILATAAFYWTTDSMSSGGWRALVAGNTTGWILAGAGVVMLGSGLLVRKKPGRKKAEVALVPGPSGLSAVGRF